MSYPPGVQTATLTFSNAGTFLGHEASATTMEIVATASVVWAATGAPIDNFTEAVAPGEGMPGSLTVPFVDQTGFVDGAGNAFTMWAYRLTRRSRHGSESKVVTKTWQPIIGQDVIDFDMLPGTTIGLPVSTVIPPVTSVAGLTNAVGAEELAGALAGFLPDGVTEANVTANLPARLGEEALNATIATATAPKMDTATAASTYSLQAGAGDSLAPLRAVAIGDSTTAGSQYTPGGINVLTTNTWPPMTPQEQTIGPVSWFVHMCLQSGGQIINWYNAGIGSDTTTGMLARFDADVITKGGDILFLGDAHNDFSGGSGISEATTRANIIEMVSRARKAGMQVIFTTNYPENLTLYQAPIRRHNKWLKRYGEMNRIPVIDKYAALVDPASATGSFAAPYHSDGTHATVLGAKVAGKYALDSLGGILRSRRFGSSWLPSDSATDTNLIANALMLADANADTRADSWSVSASGGTSRVLTDAATTNGSAVITSATGAFTSDDIGRTVTGAGIQSASFITEVTSATQIKLGKTATATGSGVSITLSGVGVQIVTNASLPAGKLTQFKVTSGTADIYQTINVDGVKVSVGDRLKWCGVFSTSVIGTLTYQMSISFTGVSNWSIKPVTGIPLDYDLTYFECEAIVPAGATAVKPDVYVSAGAGTLTTGMWGLYNLTKLGA